MSKPFTIEELTLPETLDSPGAEDFRAAIDVHNAVATDILGKAAATSTPEEFLPSLQEQTWEHKRVFIAKQNGVVTATALMVWSVEPDTRVTWMEVGVHPDWRNQGIGTALFDHLEAEAQSSGRPIVQGGGMHQTDIEGERLESPTGFGSLPKEEPGVRFLLQRGYSLEQVYRVSLLHLPIDPATLDEHLAKAMERAGDDYRVQAWIGDTPERWQDDVAIIMNRMSTDAPAGNLEIEEEPWDAERVRQNDERRRRSRRTALVATVEHIPSGRLVAFNGLSLAEDHSRPVHQGVTLVLKEHRGHRLGMVTKVANIQQLAQFSPETPFIITDNAEENRPMLDVNEAVGFVPAAYVGAWKKEFS